MSYMINNTFSKSLMIALLTGSTAFSQVATKTPQANSAEKSEEIITLSPFVVTDAGDEGYRTQQTMIGSRTAKNRLGAIGGRRGD
jgi:hypothetical protein